MCTYAEGRGDVPLLEGAAMIAGRYRLGFGAGAYFRRIGARLADPPFGDGGSLDFGVADIDAPYHVPLLVSPWSYSTYRGSWTSSVVNGGLRQRLASTID